MAGNSLGSLTVSLTVDAASFTQGMTKAEYAAAKSAQAISDSFKGIFAGDIAAHFADKLLDQVASLPGKIAEGVTGAIEAAAKLDDLSKIAGTSVEALGGIGFAGKQVGLDLDTTSQGVTKLNRALAEAAAGNKEQAAAFNAVGIAVKDSSGNVIGADTAIAKLADKFAGYTDGANKTALAIAFFGRAGAELIPLLDQGGAALQRNIDFYTKYSGVSSDTAAKAHEFDDTLQKLNLLTSAFSQNLASALLPSLQAVADKLLEAKTSGDGFKSFAEDIAYDLQVAANIALYFAEKITAVGKAIGLVAALASVSGDLLQQGGVAAGSDIPTAPSDDDVKKAQQTQSRFKAIFDEYKADTDATAEHFKSLKDAINGVTRAGAAVQVEGADYSHEGRDGTGAGQKKVQAPALPARGGATDDPTKKLLENQVKAIQDGIAAEKDAFSERNKFLDLFNQEGLLSIQQYYDARRQSQTDALAVEVGLFNQEIAAENAFANKSTTSQKDKAEAQGKAAEFQRQLNKAQSDSAAATDVLNIQQKLATESLQKQFDGLVASALEFKGDLTDAAAIKFDAANKDVTKAANNNGNLAAQQALKDLRAAAIAQAQFNQAQQASSLITSRLSNAEDAINRAQASGAITSIEALAEVGNARKQQIALLESQVKIEEDVALASGNPALIQNAEAARAALEKLKDTADPLGDELRNIFGSALNDPLSEFIQGTKSAKDAFAEFATNVKKNVADLISKDLTNLVFGKDGLLGSVFGKISDAIGGAFGGAGVGQKVLGGLGDAAGKTASDAASATASTAASTGLTAVGTTSTATTTALTALTSAAGQAATALAGLGGGGAAKDVGDGLSDLGDDDGEVGDIFGSFFGAAKGQVFAGGNVIPFARGGIFDQPTFFGMNGGGMGVMGEAGAEAVMPLTRGPNGKLGVMNHSNGTAAPSTTINLHYYPTPGESRASTAQRGAELFRQGQMAASRNG